jgi:hypothetical protein
MALINEYLAKLKADLVVTLLLVSGGEDNLDIQAGESTLTPETIEKESEALLYLKARRDWLVSTIAGLEENISLGFDEIPPFDVSQSVKDEITLKQAQMKLFSDLLRPIVIGADGVIVTERATVIAEPTGGN